MNEPIRLARLKTAFIRWHRGTQHDANRDWLQFRNIYLELEKIDAMDKSSKDKANET